jgi:hypothetical protein
VRGLARIVLKRRAEAPDLGKMARGRMSRGAALLAAALVLAAGCSGSQSDDGAVPAGAETTADDVVSAEATRSHDGDTTILESPGTFDARVSVPDAALGGGVESDDITARVVAIEGEDGDGAAISFVLGPDGAEFSEPVLLEWDGPWAPDADVVLSAATNDGKPIADEANATSNSAAALEVEPTSATTAHYTLPVDHFSVWTVYMSVVISGVELPFTATGQTPQPIAVDQPTTVNVTLGTENFVGAQMCANAIVAALDGPVRAHFAARPAECVLVSDPNLGLQRLLTIECTSAGTGTVAVTLYGLVMMNSETLDESRIAKLRALMFSTAFDLGGERSNVSFDDRQARTLGGMSAARVTLPVTCVKAASDTTTTSAPGLTTTTGARRTTTTEARNTPGSTGAAVTTTTIATSPGTSAPTPTTSARPPATAPAPTTTTPAPPTTTWGPEGEWAFNDFDHCDWNGTGGCGWYYGDDPGEYWMGPIGCPGMRVSAVASTQVRMSGC